MGAVCEIHQSLLDAWRRIACILIFELILVKAIPAFTGQISRMVQAVRFLLALSMIVSVALYGAVAAVASTQGTVVSEMVICSDGGEQTIWVDAAGNPAQSPDECCNCLKCLHISADGLMPVSVRSVFAQSTSSGPVRPAVAAPAHRHHLRPQPRGPPAAIKVIVAGSVIAANRAVAQAFPTLLETHQAICGQSVSIRRATM